MNVTEMNQSVFDQMYYVLLDELDWPMLSATSAYYNNTDKWKFIIDGPVQSLYQYMYENNKCIHRDYQNLGVNGARSSSMAHQLIQTIARDNKIDHPIWGLWELIGNDVCNGHPGTSHMTTPDEFYANNMESFTYLDSVLPNGSRILTMGLAVKFTQNFVFNDKLSYFLLCFGYILHRMGRYYIMPCMPRFIRLDG